jgi:hypothetical protein
MTIEDAILDVLTGTVVIVDLLYGAKEEGPEIKTHG